MGGSEIFMETREKLSSEFSIKIEEFSKVIRL
jgi:hypothetical protein